VIYLASPYTHHDPDVQEQRYRQAMAAAAHYIREGRVIYSPIVACHPMALAHDLPGDWSYWQAFDRDIISRCDCLWVLCLPGWQHSHGVQAEIEIAIGYNKRVEYIDWDADHFGGGNGKAESDDQV
jgi:hypothetical protein